MFLLHVLQKDLASEVASEHLLDFNSCLHFLVILLLDADPELSVAVQKILLVDSDGHLLGHRVFKRPFSFGVLV